MNTVSVKAYSLPPVNKKEVLRYLGVKELTPETDALFRECALQFADGVKYSVCYTETDVAINENVIDFGIFKVTSRDLALNLKGSQRAVIFAATLGISADRIILKNSKLSPAKAVVTDAIASERIEALCDVFNEEIKNTAFEKGYKTAPRFSAGYGDFPLEMQSDILNALDSCRKIGLTLNDSFLMSPSKSVTAVIGIETEKK